MWDEIVNHDPLGLRKHPRTVKTSILVAEVPWLLKRVPHDILHGEIAELDPHTQTGPDALAYWDAGRHGESNRGSPSAHATRSSTAVRSRRNRRQRHTSPTHRQPSPHYQPRWEAGRKDHRGSFQAQHARVADMRRRRGATIETILPASSSLSIRTDADAPALCTHQTGHNWSIGASEQLRRCVGLISSFFA